jgi:type I restriction enzyme, S subunit
VKEKWPTKMLGNICDILDSRRKPITKRDREAGEYPYYGATGILDHVSGYLFDEPLVLVGEDGAKWASGDSTAFAVEGKVWVNNHAHVIRPHRTQVIDNWLIHFLNHSDLTQFVSGLTVPKLNQGTLREIPIPVPPIPEQKRIVAILDEAFEGIVTARVNAEKNLQNAELLFSAGFGGLTSAAESKKWPRTTVGEVASSRKGSIRTGPFGSQLLHSEFVNDGIAVLGIDNAVANEFRWGKARFITPEKYRQLERYRVYPGDVLITIMGTCGRCAIVPDTIPTAINTKHLCCITLDLRKCLPGYLHAYFLHHPLALEFLAKHAKGAIMAGLNMGLIEEIPVLLPPLERQRELIVALDRLKTKTQRLAGIYKRKIAGLDTLKQSLLHHAFAGELMANKTSELIEAVA